MSEGPASPRPWWHPLPGEWVLAAFAFYAVGFVAWRAGLGAVWEMEPLLGARAKRVLLALVIVSTVLLARRAWVATGAVPERYRRVTLSLSTVAFIPLALAAWVQWMDQGWWHAWSDAKPDDMVHLVGMALLRIFGVGSMPVALWLAVVLHLQERATFAWGDFLTSTLKGLAWTAREWAPVAILIPAYSWMEGVIGTPAVIRDPWMMATDRLLFGGEDPVALAQRIISVPLSEWMAFSYSFYAVFYPLSLGAALMWGGRPALREGVTALSLGLAITYVGYSLVPVKGPLLTGTYEVPLDLYLIKEVKAALMDSARITYDCFPSFHTAGSVIMAWLCFRHARRLFWWTLPMAASTPVACVYLRYHYVSDVLAGLALAGLVAWVTPLWIAR